MGSFKSVLICFATFSLAAVCCLSEAASTGVGFQIVGANENRTDFYILETSRELLLPNLRRTEHFGGRLKLSLQGGITIDKLEQPYEKEAKWTLSLSDTSKLEFSLAESLSATTYQIRWHDAAAGKVNTTAAHTARELCFHYGQHNASWYNAYQSYTPHWPMDSAKLLPREAFANLRNFSFDDTKEDFYLVLEHLFINTDGFAIFLDDRQPLFIRRDPNKGDPLLCFSTDTKDPYLSKTDDKLYRDLKLHIFAAIDIRHVLEYVIQHSRLIPHPTGIPDVKEFTHPTWSDYAVARATPLPIQSDILKLATEIEKHGFSTQSEILIDDYLEKEYGDLSFNKKQFPDPKKMIEELHKKGFRVGLGIEPQIHERQPHTEEFFIKDVRDLKPTVLVDFSNPEACTWYEYMLRKLHFEYGVDAFQLSSIPIHWNLHFNDTQVQKYPGLLSTRYIETVARLGNKVVSEIGYKTQHLPIFVKFSQSKSMTKYDHLLEALIPNALALSIAGYAYFVPYQIGGYNRDVKPTEEQYIRWVQAVTFMPSMAFLHTPWSYQNVAVTKITKKFVDLHAAHAQTFVHLAQNRARVGWPIIRPMWYLDPNDAETYHIKDQFMVGDDILVAPVLKTGQRERSVYLPKGIWKDQQGQEYIGNIWIKVQVPLEELTYYKRLIK